MRSLKRCRDCSDGAGRGAFARRGLPQTMGFSSQNEQIWKMFVRFLVGDHHPVVSRLHAESMFAINEKIDEAKHPPVLLKITRNLFDLLRRVMRLDLCPDVGEMRTRPFAGLKSLHHTKNIHELYRILNVFILGFPKMMGNPVENDYPGVPHLWKPSYGFPSLRK